MVTPAIDSIHVGARTVIARVRIGQDSPLSTGDFAGFSDRAHALLPGLERHRCENGSSFGFLRELGDTEIPHAVEHVAVELMALAGSPRSLKGETTWDFARDGRGVFHVSIEYDDDLVAVGALREAVGIVGWLLSPLGDAPSVDAVVGRLRSLRRYPA